MVHKRRYMAGPALLAPTADLGWVSSYLLSEAGWRGGRSLKKTKEDIWMASKLAKNSSKLLVIREMQIKTTIRYF